ncbi:MAG: DUF4384 domain-containing protein [Granulosicoccus sp.]
MSGCASRPVSEVGNVASNYAATSKSPETTLPETTANLTAPDIPDTKLPATTAVTAVPTSSADSGSQRLPSNAPAADKWSDVGAASPLVIRVQSLGGLHLSAGDLIKIEVEPAQDSQIHCYYRDGEGLVTRLFPNRFNAESLVRSGETLVLPESDEWQLSATIAGASEDFMCIAIAPEWFDQLSVIPLLPDLQPKPAADLSQIYNRYKEAMGTKLIKQSISIAVH